MNAPTRSFVAVLLGLAASCAGGADTAKTRQDQPQDSMVTGQLLLPGGFKRRGVELHVTVTPAEGESRDTWVMFDEKGHFSHSFEGNLSSVAVLAGASSEVYRMNAKALQQKKEHGRFDVGPIDLRDLLKPHRLVVRDADGQPPGQVRVGMWPRPPAKGPYGGNVSLGSKQFPTRAIGEEQEWLVSPKAKAIYFLVERRAEGEQDGGWRSGPQRLFGPFTPADLPTELRIDGLKRGSAE